MPTRPIFRAERNRRVSSSVGAAICRSPFCSFMWLLMMRPFSTRTQYTGSSPVSANVPCPRTRRCADRGLFVISMMYYGSHTL